jgi:hypothetical protein
MGRWSTKEKVSVKSTRNSKSGSHALIEGKNYISNAGREESRRVERVERMLVTVGDCGALCYPNAHNGAAAADNWLG